MRSMIGGSARARCLWRDTPDRTRFQNDSGPFQDAGPRCAGQLLPGQPREPIIIESPLARAVSTLLSVVGMFAVLAAITLLAAASPAWEPAPHGAEPAAEQAAADGAPQSPASSPMLRASGFAMAKDKLD